MSGLSVVGELFLGKSPDGLDSLRTPALLEDIDRFFLLSGVQRLPVGWCISSVSFQSLLCSGTLQPRARLSKFVISHLVIFFNTDIPVSFSLAKMRSMIISPNMGETRDVEIS